MMKRMSVVLLALVVLACVAMPAFATTWYVDAENGNDDWNGKADFANAVPASNIGPKKTLAVFTNLLASSDTIYAAPGWYTNGVATSNSRFYSNVGRISLIATGDASNTFIGGAPDPDVNLTTSPYGCGPKAIVAVRMTGYNNLLQGFTIVGGRSAEYVDREATRGGGVVFSGFSGGDRMVDCIVTNCAANRGGGVYTLQYALRCRVTGNFADNGAHAMFLNTAVNCIFENTEAYGVYNNSSSGTFLNCLFRGNKTGNIRTNPNGQINVYNSVFLLADGTVATQARNKRCYFYNCLFDFDPTARTDVEAMAGTNGECRVVATGSLKFNNDGSPTWGCAAIGAAKASYYEDKFPSVFDASEKGYDFTKNARTVGDAMDIGATERIDGTLDDNIWYVDAENGDDANSGRTLAQAFQTLARASTNALMEAGATVYVAEGVYSSGVVPAALCGAGVTDCRMLVPNKVDFVAMGRREATIIEGASSTATTSGIGPGAVRCCFMRGGSLSGFTLRKGNVNADPNDVNGDKGGGIYCTTSTSLAYDCEITGCNAVRGAGAAGATLIRCYIHGNTQNVTGVDTVLGLAARSPTATGAFSCSACNTVIDGTCYTGGTYLNCTLLGNCWGSGATYANSYVGADGASVKAVAATFTNCVCAQSFKDFTRHDGCVENTPCRFGLKARPVGDDSAVVNAGDYLLYSNRFPVAFAAYRDIDYAGNPRVLDGCIDIGATEYKPVGSTILFR